MSEKRMGLSPWHSHGAAKMRRQLFIADCSNNAPDIYGFRWNRYWPIAMNEKCYLCIECYCYNHRTVLRLFCQRISAIPLNRELVNAMDEFAKASHTKSSKSIAIPNTHTNCQLFSHGRAFALSLDFVSRLIISPTRGSPVNVRRCKFASRRYI